MAEEEEGEAVSSFLQELMDRELLGPETAQDLLLDLDQARRKTRDPCITMEARHRQACDHAHSKGCLVFPEGLPWCYFELEFRLIS